MTPLLIATVIGLVPAFGDMGGRGWRGFQILGSIASVFGGLVMFAIVAALVYFLLRFLIIGTKAAQLFIDQNSPTGPTAPPTTGAPASDSPAEPTVAEPTVAEPTVPAEENVSADQPADDPATTMVLPPVETPTAGSTSATADAPTTPLTPAKPPRAPRAPRTPKPRE